MDAVAQRTGVCSTSAACSHIWRASVPSTLRAPRQSNGRCSKASQHSLQLGQRKRCRLGIPQATAQELEVAARPGAVPQ